MTPGESRVANLPPRRVGEYDVLAPLGRGGAGEVFLALRHGPHEFRKLVVIKLLHSHFESDPEVVEMFLDEARLAGRLDHPNIAQTLEVGVSRDRHFMVMGYLEGMGLDRLLAALGERHERMPPALAAWIAAEVLSGLDYAHDLRDHDGTPLEVVHRDVSPSNVFLCWDGTVKLIDFGIAKAAIRRANTDSGIIKGKWGYIAPEHATGEGTDRRADVWSAGVVLWEMLTGEKLFPHLNDVTTLQALVAGDLRTLESVAPETPETLRRVVARALRQEPDERYPTARAMGADLRAYLGDMGKRVRREDLADLLGDAFEGEREAQQGLLADLVGGALALSRTGSFGVSEKKPETTRAVPVLDPPPARSWKLPLLLAAAAVACLTMIGVGGALEEEPDEPVASEPVMERAPEPATPPPVEPPPEPEPEPAVEAPAIAAPVAAPSTMRRPGLTAEPRTEAEPPIQPPAREPADHGWLSLVTTPWSNVSVDGTSVGTTPLLRLPLSPGEHELVLENPDRGLRRVHLVTIRADEHVRRRVALE